MDLPAEFTKGILTTVFAGCVLTGVVLAQAPPVNTVAPASAIAPASPTSSITTSSTAPSIAPGTTVTPGKVESAENYLDAPENSVDPATLLPNLPNLPNHKASLVGGTIQRLDRVRDEVTLQVFGGGKMKIYFDPRTHIYDEKGQATTAELRPGDRVSIDTILDGSAIFARNIRLKTPAAGESQGTVVSYRADRNELFMRDALSPRPVKMRLTSQTRFVSQGHAISSNQIVPGTLIAVRFGSQKNSDVAQEVTVLATPGANFTFVGQITSLDLSTGLLVLTSTTDGKTYEIYFDPSAVNSDNLRPAADVTVLTRFDGKRYVAQDVTVR